MIAERFALPDASARIKPLDRALLAAERRVLSEESWHWPELDEAEEIDVEVDPWGPERAAREFRKRFERLQDARS